MARELTRLNAIHEFFERGGGRKVEISKLKALSAVERKELAEQCAKELGVELVEKQ